ncbi:MAG: MATE family efflux transporter [Gaiellales bacterium]
MTGSQLRLRSHHDREIFRLATPALGALAAEPLYVLADTAIVGHLGRTPLAGLGAAATALGTIAMFNFVQYGTTAQVARAAGAGERGIANRLGAQALWLSLAIGVVLAIGFGVFAGPVIQLVGVEGRSAELGETYLRIVALGLPSVFVALGTQGYLRGIDRLRGPVVILVLGNIANVALELVLVYGLDLGIRGSAWGTAIAQTGMGAAFAIATLRTIGPERRLDLVLARRLLAFGKYVLIRTTSLIAALFVAGAVAARLGDAELGAYQISFQVWLFLALVLDAVAIAGQVIIGRELGAGRADDAYAAGARIVALAVATGAVFTVLLLVFDDLLPRAFADDPSVLRQCALLWPVFALMQPLNGAVFALDGILIGASDGPFIAGSMIVSFAVCVSTALVASSLDWGVRGVWLALLALILTRLMFMGGRFRRRGWLVTGW